MGALRLRLNCITRTTIADVSVCDLVFLGAPPWADRRVENPVERVQCKPPEKLRLTG